MRMPRGAGSLARHVRQQDRSRRSVLLPESHLALVGGAQPRDTYSKIDLMAPHVAGSVGDGPPASIRQ